MKNKVYPLLLVSVLFLSACSSGGSSNTGAAAAADPVPGDTEADADTTPLALSCNATPKTAKKGDPVTATFKFNQSFVGSGTLSVGTQGAIVTDISKVAISGEQLIVNRKVTSSIGETFVINLNVAGTKLSASCKWFVTVLVQP